MSKFKKIKKAAVDSIRIVEAIALNQDIAFIQVGQKAELNWTLFQKCETIETELYFVRPDAQEDQKIGLVYKVKSKPKRLRK